MQRFLSQDGKDRKSRFPHDELINFNEIIIRIKRIEEEDRVNGADTLLRAEAKPIKKLQHKKDRRSPITEIPAHSQVVFASRDAYVNER